MLTYSPRRSSRAFRAIADPTRRAILDRLRRHEAQTVEEIASGFRISRPAVSQHLAVLHKASLVRRQKRGRQRLYSLSPAPLAEVDAWLTSFRVHLAASLVRLKDHAEQTFAATTNPEPKA